MSDGTYALITKGLRLVEEGDDAEAFGWNLCPDHEGIETKRAYPFPAEGRWNLCPDHEGIETRWRLSSPRVSSDGTYALITKGLRRIGSHAVACANPSFSTRLRFLLIWTLVCTQVLDA